MAPMSGGEGPRVTTTPWPTTKPPRGWLTEWELLDDVAGSGASRLAAQTAVAFYTPACVAGGQAFRGVELASRAGLRIRHLARVVLDADQVHRIWEPQSAGFARDRWAVATSLFCAGPGVVAVYSADGDETAAVRLKRLQGPSSPGRLEPGHLRHELGAVNKINNLVHVPADVEATVRELPIMLGADGARLAWLSVLERRVVVPDELGRQLGDDSDAVAGLGRIVSRLRWRAYLLGQARRPAPPGLDKLLAEHVDRARSDGAKGFLATRAWRATDGREEFADRFASWLGASSPVAVAAARLDDVAVGRPVSAVSVSEAVHEAGLSPSPWEVIALTTAAVACEIDGDESATLLHREGWS
jgi:hypothetical protein